MARIELKKGTGPSPWHIMLAGFDVHPAGAYGIRDLTFTLMDGSQFRMALRGIDWGEYPNINPWTLTGYNVDFPNGYSYPYSTSNTIEVKYDPFKKGGEVELKLLSPCHLSLMDFSRGDGVSIGSCPVCGESAVRVNPRTGVQEWLDGNSPWTEKINLRPVGVKPVMRVWVTHRPGLALTEIDTLGPEVDRSQRVQLQDLVEVVRRRLWVDHSPPDKKRPRFYIFNGSYHSLTLDEQSAVDATIGEAAVRTLCLAETYPDDWDNTPVELGEAMPPLQPTGPMGQQ